MPIKLLISRGGRFIIRPPQIGSDHQVGGMPVAGYRNVVEPALAQQHLDIRLMRVRGQIINEENAEVNFALHHHGGNLGIPTHRAGFHLGNVRSCFFLLQGIFHQGACGSCTNQFVFDECFLIIDNPVDHVCLTGIMGNQGNCLVCNHGVCFCFGILK